MNFLQKKVVPLLESTWLT